MSKSNPLPSPDTSGCFIPTLNDMGYMTTKLDYFSQAFVDYAASIHDEVLEIGAAYGIATLAAIKKGAKVICNDLDPRHLEIIQQLVPLEFKHNLILVPGSFPGQLSFPKNSLGAVLICRVLHFFRGETIELSLEKIYSWLKPGGKVFIIADTPYMKNWSAFIPEYEKRIRQRERWPGLITDLQHYQKEIINNLPPLVHALDDRILSRTLLEKGFIIEKISMINRCDDFPPNRRLDGRESVGAIGIKPT